MQKRIADNLTQNLADIDLIEVAPLIPYNEYKDKEDIEKLEFISNRTSAKLVVSGAIYKQGDELLFQPRITDISTGEPALSMPDITCSLSEISTGIDKIRKKVMGAQMLIYNRWVADYLKHTARMIPHKKRLPSPFESEEGIRPEVSRTGPKGI